MQTSIAMRTIVLAAVLVMSAQMAATAKAEDTTIIRKDRSDDNGDEE
jgi:hypothetical protein